MPSRTGGEYLAQALQQAGVSHVFHVPTALFPTMRALEGLPVQRILTHGEKAAAYMADGYARASGRPGVCMAQNIGAANLAAGIADPYLGCSPVIAFTGATSPDHRYRHAYQEFEHSQFGPVTKSSVQVDRASRLPDLLRQAFRTATTGTPGPVHLDVRDEALSGTVEGEVVIESPFLQLPPFRPAPDPAALDRALAALLSAERPIIVAGGGVITSQAWDELLALAERLNIPVATSLNAKTSFPNTHPLSVGVVGRYSRWCANRAVSEADLVLFVGTRAGGMTTYEWRVPRQGVRTIQINIDPEELGRNYPAEVAVLADAKLALAALAEAAPSRPAGPWNARVAEHVAAWRAEYAELRASDATPMRPERLCSELAAWLPENAILTADTGHSGIWTATMVDIDRTGNNYLRAAGSLGWGLPATIGAKCGAPGRPVIGFTGDGGFWYHIAELETAVCHGIAPVIVVNDNHSLNQEWGPLRQVYGGELPRGAMELMEFTDVNLAEVARAMGCHAERVERPQDLRPALDRALAAGRIAVVDVVTDMMALGPTAREYGPE